LDIFNNIPTNILVIGEELEVVYLKYSRCFQMEKGENIAGGMSYRTLEGFDAKRLKKYLDGTDDESYMEILQENKNYYVASAEKTIARLNLAKKRVKHGLLNTEYAQIINTKIYTSLKWLEKLEENIKSITNKSEILEVEKYKKWHAVKLLPSTAEGILITSFIKDKIDNLSDNPEINNEKLTEARIHNKKAEAIFLTLLTNLSESLILKQLKDRVYAATGKLF